MTASKRAGCPHPAHKVQLVFYLGDAFTARPARKTDPEGTYQTHAIYWCSDCGAICVNELHKATNMPHEVWRSPRML